MRGRKISKEQFKKNYTNAAKSGPELRRRKKWAIKNTTLRASEKGGGIIEAKVPVHNPMPLYYDEIKRETEKAYCFSLRCGQTCWFPKRYCKLDTNNHIVVVPTVFAREKGIYHSDVLAEYLPSSLP